MKPRLLWRGASPEAGLRHGQCSWSVQSGSARPTMLTGGEWAEIPAVEGVLGLPVHEEDIAVGDDGGDWIGRRGDAVLLGGDRFGTSNADDNQQYRRDADPKEGARAAPAPWHRRTASSERRDR